jgi:hypothetical protein
MGDMRSRYIRHPDTRSEMGVNVIGIGSPGGWIIDNLEVPLRIRTNGIANRHG